MKKLLVALLAAGLMLGSFGTALAGTQKIQIINQLLDDDPTSITGVRNTENYDRIAFFVDYDETDSGGLVSIAITVDISHDGTNWIDADFSDFGAAGETTETLTDDGHYFCWLDNAMHIPYVRLSIVATGTTAVELADVDGYLVGYSK